MSAQEIEQPLLPPRRWQCGTCGIVRSPGFFHAHQREAEHVGRIELPSLAEELEDIL